MSTTLLRGGRLVQDGCITRCDILLRGKAVDAVLPPDSGAAADFVYDLAGLYVSAGFIDIHVHGGGGHDFMDGTPEAYHGASALHLRHGTTAMVPTTLAASKEELLRSFSVFERCRDGFADGAKLLGLHIEGPYIAKSQCGAQDPRFIREPDPAEYNELLDACPHILRWTIAPELPGAREMGLALLARGVLPSIGHSEADSEAVRAAIPCGYRHVTHLYSAMSTIVRKAGFRHAGIVESAYLYDELSSEIIADGCHLPAPLLQLAYRHIGPQRLVLVTDAMRGAGQTQGESILGSLENGQRVILEDGVAKMPDRTAFAGSICTADRLVRTMEECNMIFAAAPSQNEMLAALAAQPGIEWNRVNAFHMDEYIGLAPDAPQGFANFLRAAIFTKVPFRSVNCLDGTAASRDPAAECARYSQLLRRFPVDITCMGIGENGHIAFNDPPVADFDDPALVKPVALDEICRNQQVHDGCFATLDDVPTHALTLTVPALMHAAQVFCVVPAATKARAVRDTLLGDIRTACPASILRRHPAATLYLDADSASLL